MGGLYIDVLYGIPITVEPMGANERDRYIVVLTFGLTAAAVVLILALHDIYRLVSETNDVIEETVD